MLPTARSPSRTTAPRPVASRMDSGMAAPSFHSRNVEWRWRETHRRKNKKHSDTKAYRRSSFGILLLNRLTQVPSSSPVAARDLLLGGRLTSFKLTPTLVAPHPLP